MTKIYKELTADQKSRGVIFSSTLSYTKDDQSESLRTHEVMSDDERANVIIKNLLDDSFFNGSAFKYNVIRK